MKNEPPPPEHTQSLLDTVPFLMHRLIRLMIVSSNRDFSRFGLDVSSARVMIAIRQNIGISISELSELACMELSTLSYMLRRLEKSGLTTRAKGKSDNRQIILGLTEKGAAVAWECEKLIWTHDAIMTSGLSKRKKSELCRLLDGMYHRAGKVIQELEAAEKVVADRE